MVFTWYTRYRSGPAEEATRAYDKLAQKFGLSLTELSMRWAKARSSSAGSKEEARRRTSEGTGASTTSAP